MSEEIWTITKTGVLKPGEGENLAYWQREQFEQENCTWRFGSFEGARHAFRDIVADFAATRSSVFDGRGSILELGDVFEGHRHWYDEFGPAIVERNVWKLPKEVVGYNYQLMTGDFECARMVPAMLRAWLLDMGAFKRNPLPTFRWTDWVFGIVSTPNLIALGCTCGNERIEQYDTQVYTNAFDMCDPDGDYEFSVRNYFDVYDPEEARSLRLRLAKGPARKGGHFPWPGEDSGNGYHFSDGPAPCLGGMIDDSEQVSIVVYAGKDERADRVPNEYRSLIDRILDYADERGFVVDRKSRSSLGGALSNDEAHLYQAEGEGAWSHIRFTACFEPQYGRRPDALIAIGGKIKAGRAGYDSYDEAFAGAAQLIDDHLERMRSRRWSAVQDPIDEAGE